MVWISALLEASWTITPNPVTNSRASDSQSASESANKASALPATAAPTVIVAAD